MRSVSALSSAISKMVRAPVDLGCTTGDGAPSSARDRSCPEGRAAPAARPVAQGSEPPPIAGGAQSAKEDHHQPGLRADRGHVRRPGLCEQCGVAAGLDDCAKNPQFNMRIPVAVAGRSASLVCLPPRTGDEGDSNDSSWQETVCRHTSWRGSNRPKGMFHCSKCRALRPTFSVFSLTTFHVPTSAVYWPCLPDSCSTPVGGVRPCSHQS